MSAAVEIPAHQRPENCHVCGRTEAEHASTEQQLERRGYGSITGHTFWSNADAFGEAREHDRRTTVRYSTGATTPESAFVAEHIPEAVSR